MMQMNDIYDMIMHGLTEIILDEHLEGAEKIKERLRLLTQEAELMHCYIGFREENQERIRGRGTGQSLSEQGTGRELKRTNQRHPAPKGAGCFRTKQSSIRRWAARCPHRCR